MEPVSDLTEKYYRLYLDNISRIESASSPLLNNNRGKAIEQFKQWGIPSRKNEAYKYIDLSTFFRYDYESYLVPTEEQLSKASQFVCDVDDLDAESLIILNGYFPDTRKGMYHFPGGAVAGSLNRAASEYKTLVENHFGRYIKAENDGLIHLNSAMASDGLFIYVPENKLMAKPAQVINIVEADRDVFNQRRNLIIIGNNASFTLIVCDHTLAPGRFLTNTVTEIFVGDNARFDLIRLQNEHNSSFKITSTFIHQKENSTVTSCNITLHGGLVRNNTHHYLAGKGAQCDSYGLYFTDKWQQVDNYVNVEHLVPDCTSNQLFKGVLDDMSIGAFNGRIYVSPGAQKTSAYQKNNTILLSTDARMYTRPQLEIYADDVKCSHGATVGSMDDDAMFYLRSRGISNTEARLMLMTAFAEEVIDNIRIEALRQRISDLVESRLRGELTRCTSCIVKCS